MRRDSVAPGTPAYLEARVRTNTATTSPEIAFAIDDGVRFIGVGLSGTRVGFVDGAFNFIGTSVVTPTTSLQIYRLRKFGADSVELLVNGTRVTSRASTGFAISFGLGYTFFGFGGPGANYPPRSANGNSSTWDYVVYEIGATQP